MFYFHLQFSVENINSWFFHIAIFIRKFPNREKYVAETITIWCIMDSQYNKNPSSFKIHTCQGFENT